jgi:hypothetical protein
MLSETLSLSFSVDSIWLEEQVHFMLGVLFSLFSLLASLMCLASITGPGDNHGFSTPSEQSPLHFSSLKAFLP